VGILHQHRTAGPGGQAVLSIGHRDARGGG
jgi:hypothetical protein